MRIYYSRWTRYYNTSLDKRLRKYILGYFSIGDSDIIDPSKYSHRRHEMSFYYRLIDDADAIVYYEVLDGIISAGVASEVTYGLNHNKKIYKISLDGEITRIDKLIGERLSIEETRFLNETILEYDIPIDVIRKKYEEVRLKYQQLTLKEALIYACIELIPQYNKRISREYLLKWKLPRQYKIDTKKLMAKIGLIKLDKQGRRIYTNEEKEKAIQLAKKLKSIKTAANILGIPESTLRNWMYKEKIISGRKYSRYTIEQYEEAMKLLNEEYSIRKVAKILGIPESRVKSWKIYNRKPPRAKLEIKPSVSLAYMIGTLLSDGSVTEKKGYIYSIQLKVIDREYAEEFSKCAHQVLKKPYIEPKLRKDGRWEVRYYSSAFHH